MTTEIPGKECCFMTDHWLLWFKGHAFGMWKIDDRNDLIGASIDLPSCYDGWHEDLIRNGLINVDGVVQPLEVQR